jgi:hypothetical protein
MQLFKLDDKYTVVCETKNTRNGFKHEAILLHNGYEKQKAKVCYLNRTWERFTYETVLLRVILHFENAEQEHYKKIINSMG